MERKWVHLFLASLWMVLVFLFIRVEDFFLASYLPISYRKLLVYAVSVVLSVVMTILIWSSRRFRNFVQECFAELEKVAWPTGKDTISAALVVVCVVVVVSVFLGLFDWVWQGLFRLIY